MAEIWRQPSPRESVSLACEDHLPEIQRNSLGGVRIELGASYIVELTPAECQRIARLIVD